MMQLAALLTLSASLELHVSHAPANLALLVATTVLRSLLRSQLAVGELRQRPDNHAASPAGNDNDGWSQEKHFTLPRHGFPVRFGFIGDLGETANSSDTLQHLAYNKSGGRGGAGRQRALGGRGCMQALGGARRRALFSGGSADTSSICLCLPPGCALQTWWC